MSGSARAGTGPATGTEAFLFEPTRRASRSASTWKRRGRHLRRSRVLGILTWVPVVLLFAAAAWLALPSRVGGRTAYVLVAGDSMQPTLDPGDLVVTRTRDEYDIDTLISYPVPDGQPAAGQSVIHRVVGYDGDRMITKGDSNESQDMWRVHPDDVTGAVVLRVPYGIHILHVLALVGCLAAGLLAVSMLWPRRASPREAGP